VTPRWTSVAAEERDYVLALLGAERKRQDAIAHDIRHGTKAQRTKAWRRVLAIDALVMQADDGRIDL